eukprot:COSAG01_NODE_16598_length_1222_cov_2.993767_1_plen_110_part_00
MIELGGKHVGPAEILATGHLCLHQHIDIGPAAREVAVRKQESHGVDHETFSSTGGSSPVWSGRGAQKPGQQPHGSGQQAGGGREAAERPSGRHNQQSGGVSAEKPEGEG